MRTYISLDIETTGFDAAKDQVIEIAAIKFNEDGIIDTFNQLVNPQINLPPIISHITGIKKEDLTDAPLFSEIKDKLKEFLGTYPIIGHNISFDINFLNEKGMGLINPLYDTLQLAGMMIPGLVSYSLDTLTRTLKIKHEQKHRAYDDALACYELYNIIKEKINQLDSGILAAISDIIGKSKIPFGELFQIAPAEPREIKFKVTKNRKTETEPSAPFDEISYLGFYDENGPFSKVVKHYEARPTQKQMTAQIDEAFNNRTSLLVEAGTGTGKTMAYLLAAIYHCLKNNRQIVISTYTKNLQEQIIDKDIPLLQKALHQINPDINITCASLKGRRNYLSGKRLELYLQKNHFEEYEAVALIKVLIWMNITKTGNFEEITLMNKEYSILDEICCAEYVCPHEDHEYAQNCWMIKAREKAENANLLVVNHALLMQDAISEKPLLPEPSARQLIVDEAHHLEKVATETMTITLAFNQFIKPFERLHHTLIDFTRQPADLFNQFQQQSELETIKVNLEHLINKIEIFFGLLGIFIEKNLEPFEFHAQILLQNHHLNSNDWHNANESAKAISELGKEAVDNLLPILQFNNNENKLVKQMYNYLYECEKRLSDLQSVFNNLSPDNQIIWLFKNADDNVSLKSAPYSTSKTINDYLFAKKQSVILTSATLRTNNNFNYIREQLGLGQEFSELVIPSHFDYPEQVKIIIPTDLPEPNSEGYFNRCAEMIRQVIIKNGGRTLVLFTSKKALTATYMQIAPILKEQGFNVLAQGITGSRGKILEQYKEESEQSAIFGTDSFWEGIDLKGNILTCVILQKLPFDPPMDPIIQARCQRYSDSFKEFQIPRAILKFKQGFGRLIRSSKDTGSIIILDTRIIQKDYGQQFLNSLPQGIKIEYGERGQITELL